MATGIRKLYYSIREVSDLVELKPHVLRYWETEFEALKPKKNRAGNRVYTERDIDVLNRIQRLLRDEKYTIEGARQALDRELAAEAEGGDWRKDLADLRVFLSDLQQRL